MSISLDLIIAMVILAVIGGYIATSIFFLKFPNILHKKKKLQFRAVHISHRGGAGEKCENTMEAFKNALTQRTNMLEIDCHLTRDGVVVVSHDQHLLRGFELDKNIIDVDFKDLPSYKSSLKLDFQPNFVLECGEGCRIPTLQEVFTAFPDTPINIDVKTYDEELFHKVNDLIKQYHREQMVIWGGRLSKTTSALHKLNPDIPVFFSLNRVLTLAVLFYTGLLPFVPLRETALEIIMPSIALEQFSFAASWKWRTGLKIIDTLLMRPALFKHLEKRGIQTYLWVLNQEKDYDRAFKLGASGVMTDFPTQLNQYLQQHPQYMQDVGL